MALRQTVSYTQYRGHTLDTAPASEPVTANDVKAQLEIDVSDTSKDTQIELYIEAAREMVEQYTGLALITQTWLLTLDNWPNSGEMWWDGVREGAISELQASGRASNVFLPRYPLQSVDSITADGSAVVVSDIFTVDTQQKPGRLVIKSGAAWPDVLRTANGIAITYTAGYGANATDVPAALRLAIIQMAAYMFEHRGDCNTQDAMTMSGAKSLLGAYMVRGL